MFRILELTTNYESITDYDIHCTVHCCFNFNTQRTDLTFDPKVHRNQCTMYSGSLKHFRNLQCIRKKALLFTQTHMFFLPSLQLHSSFTLVQKEEQDGQLQEDEISNFSFVLSFLLLFFSPSFKIF